MRGILVKKISKSCVGYLYKYCPFKSQHNRQTRPRNWDLKRREKELKNSARNYHFTIHNSVEIKERTLTCGLIRYRRGLARSRSFSSACRRISSLRADPKADTSSLDMLEVALGSSCTSGSDFFRCNDV